MNTMVMPESLRYIVIEGVIGVGKTTLARLLADRFDGKLVLETVDENPFLPRFYDDPERWSFQTQLSYLAARFQQQKALAIRDLFHQITISDYAFDKDRIFAHLNLHGDELQLYETLYNLMQTTIPVPDLLVYLQSTPERLMQNVKKRARSYETDMDPSYIEALNESYNYYFYRYETSPLLIVDVTHIDFVENESDLEELVGQIVSIRGSGTHIHKLIR